MNIMANDNNENFLIQNYRVIKDKIVPTDHIIRSYNSKCIENKALSKRIDDLVRLVEQLNSDCKKYETQLCKMQQETEPLKPNLSVLNEENIKFAKEIGFLKDKLAASQGLVHQYVALLKEKENESVEIESKKIMSMEKEIRNKNTEIRNVRDELRKVRGGFKKGKVLKKLYDHYKHSMRYILKFGDILSKKNIALSEVDYKVISNYRNLYYDPNMDNIFADDDDNGPDLLKLSEEIFLLSNKEMNGQECDEDEKTEDVAESLDSSFEEVKENIQDSDCAESKLQDDVPGLNVESTHNLNNSREIDKIHHTDDEIKICTNNAVKAVNDTASNQNSSDRMADSVHSTQLKQDVIVSEDHHDSNKVSTESDSSRETNKNTNKCDEKFNTHETSSFNNNDLKEMETENETNNQKSHFDHRLKSEKQNECDFDKSSKEMEDEVIQILSHMRHQGENFKLLSPLSPSPLHQKNDGRDKKNSSLGKKRKVSDMYGCDNIRNKIQKLQDGKIYSKNNPVCFTNRSRFHHQNSEGFNVSHNSNSQDEPHNSNSQDEHHQENDDEHYIANADSERKCGLQDVPQKEKSPFRANIIHCPRDESFKVSINLLDDSASKLDHKMTSVSVEFNNMTKQFNISCTKLPCEFSSRETDPEHRKVLRDTCRCCNNKICEDRLQKSYKKKTEEQGFNVCQDSSQMLDQDVMSMKESIIPSSPIVHKSSPRKHREVSTANVLKSPGSSIVYKNSPRKQDREIGTLDYLNSSESLIVHKNSPQKQEKKYRELGTLDVLNSPKNSINEKHKANDVNLLHRTDCLKEKNIINMMDILPNNDVRTNNGVQNSAVDQEENKCDTFVDKSALSDSLNSKPSQIVKRTEEKTYLKKKSNLSKPNIKEIGEIVYQNMSDKMNNVDQHKMDIETAETQNMINDSCILQENDTVINENELPDDYKKENISKKFVPISPISPGKHISRRNETKRKTHTSRNKSNKNNLDEKKERKRKKTVVDFDSCFWKLGNRLLDTDIDLHANSCLEKIAKLKPSMQDYKQNIACLQSQLNNPAYIPSVEKFIQSIIIFQSNCNENLFIEVKDFTSPILTNFEKNLIAFLLFLRMKKKHMKSVIKHLQMAILSHIFTKEHQKLFGKAALCRLYIGLCRQKQQLERSRIFCHDIFYKIPSEAVYLVTCACSVWPEILSRKQIYGDKMSPLERTFVQLLFKGKQLTNETRKNQCMTILRKICKINPSSENVITLSKELVSDLEHLLKENAQNQNLLAETEMAVELLAIHADCSVTQFISEVLLPVFNSWQDNTSQNVSEIMMHFCVKVIGHLSQHIPKEDNSLPTLKSVIFGLLNSSKTSIKTRETALVSLIYLQASCEISTVDTIIRWLSKHEQNLSEDTKQFVNELKLDTIVNM